MDRLGWWIVSSTGRPGSGAVEPQVDQLWYTAPLSGPHKGLMGYE